MGKLRDLQKTKSGCEKKARSQNEDDQGDAPDEIIHCGQKVTIMSNIFPLLPSPLVTSYRRLISSEENGNKHIDALSFCLRDWQLYCRTPSAPSIRKYENCFPWKDSPE